MNKPQQNPVSTLVMGLAVLLLTSLMPWKAQADSCTPAQARFNAKRWQHRFLTIVFSNKKLSVACSKKKELRGWGIQAHIIRSNYLTNMNPGWYLLIVRATAHAVQARQFNAAFTRKYRKALRYAKVSGVYAKYSGEFYEQGVKSPPKPRKSTSNMRIDSWWKSATKRVFALQVKASPNSIVQWKRTCTYRTKIGTSTQTKNGQFKIGKAGFGWLTQVAYLPSRIGYCNFTITSEQKTPWTHQVRLHTETQPNRFLRHAWAQNNTLLLITKSKLSYTKVSWTMKCSYTRRNKVGTSTRTTSKSGSFNTGKYHVQIRWFPLRKRLKETGICTLSAKMLDLGKAWTFKLF